HRVPPATSALPESRWISRRYRRGRLPGTCRWRRRSVPGRRLDRIQADRDMVALVAADGHDPARLALRIRLLSDQDKGFRLRGRRRANDDAQIGIDPWMAAEIGGRVGNPDLHGFLGGRLVAPLSQPGG